MSFISHLQQTPHMIEAVEGVKVVEELFVVPVAERIGNCPVRFVRITQRERARMRMGRA